MGKGSKDPPGQWWDDGGLQRGFAPPSSRNHGENRGRVASGGSGLTLPLYIPPIGLFRSTHHSTIQRDKYCLSTGKVFTFPSGGSVQNPPSIHHYPPSAPWWRCAPPSLRALALGRRVGRCGRRARGLRASAFLCKRRSARNPAQIYILMLMINTLKE